MGGLAEIKAGRIQHILGTLKAERGECSLEYLRGSSAAEVKAELGRFKVGWRSCCAIIDRAGAAGSQRLQADLSEGRAPYLQTWWVAGGLVPRSS